MTTYSSVSFAMSTTAVSPLWGDAVYQTISFTDPLEISVSNTTDGRYVYAMDFSSYNPTNYHINRLWSDGSRHSDPEVHEDYMGGLPFINPEVPQPTEVFAEGASLSIISERRSSIGKTIMAIGRNVGSGGKISKVPKPAEEEEVWDIDWILEKLESPERDIKIQTIKDAPNYAQGLARDCRQILTRKVFELLREKDLEIQKAVTSSLREIIDMFNRSEDVKFLRIVSSEIRSTNIIDSPVVAEFVEYLLEVI